MDFCTFWGRKSEKKTKKFDEIGQILVELPRTPANHFFCKNLGLFDFERVFQEACGVGNLTTSSRKTKKITEKREKIGKLKN